MKKRAWVPRLGNLLRPLWDPAAIPTLFVLGAIALNVLGNALYEWMRTGLGTPLWAGALALGAIVLVVALYAVPRILLGRRRLTTSAIAPRHGLVVLVSQGRSSEIPARGAIMYHWGGRTDKQEQGVLQHCWLITSRQPSKEPPEPYQSAWKNAQDLIALCDRLGIASHLKEIDPEDPEDVFDAVNAAFQEARKLKLSEGDIVADFTGGTKMMTVGMILACTPLNRAAEYMRPRAFQPDGQADPAAGSDPRSVDLSFLVGTQDGPEGTVL